MKKFLLIFLSLALVGGLTTGVYLLISNQIITLPFLEKKPEEVIKLMIDKMAEIKTYTYDADISAQIQMDLGKLGEKNPLSFLTKPPKVLGESVDLEKNWVEGEMMSSQEMTMGTPLFGGQSGPIKANLNYKLTGKVDLTDKNNPQDEAKINLGLDLAGMEMKLGGEVKIINETIYLKADQLPFPLSLVLGAEFYNQWFSLDLEELEKKRQEMAKEFGMPIELSTFDLTQNQEKLKQIQKKLNSIVNQLFQVDERLKDEIIDNEKCYHYKVILNKANLDKVISETMEILSGEILQEENLSDTKQKNLKEMLENPDFQNFLNQLSKIITKSQGEIWIDKKDFYLRKTIFDLGLDFSSLEFEKQKIPADALIINISGVLNYSNFNEPVKIETPREAKSIIQMIEETRKKAEAAKTISDIRQIQTALGMYYNDNNHYPFPPLGGSRLGIDAACLDVKGFKNQSANCKNSYVYSFLPKHPNSPLEDYFYYLCDEKNYIIEFNLNTDNGSYKAGKHYATPADIKDESRITDDCLDPDLDSLSNYFEKKYKTNSTIADTDGDNYMDGAEVMNGYNPVGKGKLKNK